MEKNNKGFSLVELIIVIAIMAVLVAIIAPNLTKYLNSSKKKTDEKNMKEIQSIMERALTDVCVYSNEPVTTNQWVQLKNTCIYYNANATGANGYDAFAKIVTKELEEIPISKVTGNPFWVYIKMGQNDIYSVQVATAHP